MRDCRPSGLIAWNYGQINITEILLFVAYLPFLFEYAQHGANSRITGRIW
jgi:hypothetical protein